MKKKRGRGRPQTWSEEADAQLIALWADASLVVAEMAQRMGLTYDAVHHRAKRLRLPHRQWNAAKHGKIMSRAITRQEMKPPPEFGVCETKDQIYVAELVRLGGFPIRPEYFIGQKGRDRYFGLRRHFIWPLAEVA